MKNSIVTVILLVQNLLGGSLIPKSTSWSGCWLVTISQEATCISTSCVSRRKQKGVTSKWKLLLRWHGFNDIYFAHSILTLVMSNCPSFHCSSKVQLSWQIWLLNSCCWPPTSVKTYETTPWLTPGYSQNLLKIKFWFIRQVLNDPKENP